MPRRFLAAVLLAVAAPASAQSIAWLEPSTHRPALAQEVLLTQTRQGAGDAAAAEWIVPVRLFQRSALTRRNLQEQPADAPDGRSLRFAPDQPGEWVIGADLPERIEAIPTPELRAFLTAHIPGEIGLPRTTTRVRRLESMTTIIAAPGDADAISVWKNGQRAEIRPLFDPLTIGTPSTFGVRTYAGDGKVVGVAVRATNIATGASTTSISDEEGIADITIDAPGLWRVEFHHAIAAKDPVGMYDLTLYTSTLTFLNGAQP